MPSPRRNNRTAPAPVADLPDELQTTVDGDPAGEGADDVPDNEGTHVMDAIKIPADAAERQPADPGLLDELRGLTAQAEQHARGDAPVPEALLGAPMPQPAPAPVRVQHANVESVHATQLFPDMFPRPVPNRPGVWVDRFGKPVAPRYRTGGQFSARLIVVKNGLNLQLRVAGFPLNELADNWGVATHEEVTKNVELVFDFEEDRDAWLRQYGRKPFDPLAKNDEGGTGTIPGLLGHRRSAMVG